MPFRSVLRSRSCSVPERAPARSVGGDVCSTVGFQACVMRVCARASCCTLSLARAPHAQPPAALRPPMRAQFFITVAKTPHLDGKHVVFGKVLQSLHWRARLRAHVASRRDLRLGHRVRAFSLNFARERSQANNSTVRVGGDDGVRASPRVACRGCSPARTQPLTAAAGP